MPQSRTGGKGLVGCRGVGATICVMLQSILFLSQCQAQTAPFVIKDDFNHAAVGDITNPQLKKWVDPANAPAGTVKINSDSTASFSAARKTTAVA